MKFGLPPDQRIILSILYDSDPLFFYELEEVFNAAKFAESNFPRFISHLTFLANEYFKRMNYDMTGFNPYLLESFGRRVSECEKGVYGLESLGLVKLSSSEPASSPNRKPIILAKAPSIFKEVVSLTKEGMLAAKRISEKRRVLIRPKGIHLTSIFVACAFGYDDVDKLYEKEFAPACGEVNYTPIRVDMNEPPQTITESIIEGITKSACVIADLTYARPSVYFEVGFAHGLGIPLLLTCRKDHYRGKNDGMRVHFDLEQYKISYWSLTKNGNFRWSKGMKPKERLATVIR